MTTTDYLQRLLIVAGSLIISLIVGTQAKGVEPFLRQWEQRYNRQGTCEVCHSGALKREHNSYGKALKRLLDRRTDANNPAKIQAALAQVEKQFQARPASTSSPTSSSSRSRYVFKGTWHTEQNIKLDGDMTAVLVPVAKEKWRGTFSGLWQGQPFTYDVDITGPAKDLQGTALIDGQRYLWKGWATTKRFVANFAGNRYVGGFELERQ